MGARGRKAAASLTVVDTSRLEAFSRPAPTANLTDEQAEIWREVVNRLPADWFPAESWPLLEQYCRHVVRARRLATLLDQAERAEEFDAKAYADLLAAEVVQSNAIAGLAMKMRLAQQATYDKSKKKAVVPAKPWETAA